jgi:hypothetical protein
MPQLLEIEAEAASRRRFAIYCRNSPHRPMSFPSSGFGPWPEMSFAQPHRLDAPGFAAQRARRGIGLAKAGCARASVVNRAIRLAQAPVRQEGAQL